MQNKKNIVMIIITGGLLLFTIFFFIYAFYQRNVFVNKYNTALELIDSKEYDKAIKILETLQDYKDSLKLLKTVQNEKEYLEAIESFENNKYDQAIEKFKKLNGFKDSDDKIIEAKYNLALEYYEKEDYLNAKKIFTELGAYMDSEFYLAQIDIKNLEHTQEIIYKKALLQFEQNNYEDSLKLFENIQDYKDSKSFIEECKLRLKREGHNNSISAGVRNSLAITHKGNVVAAGDNSDGQLDIDSWTDIVSVDSFNCLTIGLKENGNVEIAGKYDNSSVKNLEKWENIIDVAAGERFVVGLKRNGTVIADGHNDDGQINTTNWKNIIAVDAGWSFTVALTEDKELLFCGIDNGQKEEFDQHKNEWHDVVNISAGGGGKNPECRGNGHTVGLKSDGTVVAVGDNSYHQCEVSEWKDIVKISAGDWYTVGLRKDGRILITGKNFPRNRYIDEETLKKCDNIVDISAGFGQTLCLNADGTITAFGFDDDNKISGTLNWNNLMLPRY